MNELSICLIKDRISETGITYVIPAGKFGIELANRLRIEGLRIDALVDNNPEKEGEINDIMCISPELADKQGLFIVSVLDSSIRNAIHEQLIAMDVKKDHIVDYYPTHSYEFCETLDEKHYPEELREWYYDRCGKELNLSNPVSFNEKINWMKLFDKDPRKAICADKYSVRKVIKEKVGEEYLIPLLGVWDDYGEIDFSVLPDSFVLKCTHGSGWNIIIKDKKQADYDDIKEKLNNWMNLNYAFVSGLELQYMDIPHKIIAEKLICPKDNGDLMDYKFFVFDGKVKAIQVDMNRFSRHMRNIYTPQWEYIPLSICYPTNPEKNIERPVNLEEMIEISEKLGEGFRHVRVDLYDVDERIYFGELTFTHGSGTERFTPESYGDKMGDWIKL